MKKINDKQKLVIDELFANGFNRKKAYLIGYPDTNEDFAQTNVQRLFTKDYIIDYYDEKYKQYQLMMGTDAFQMVENLKHQVEQYEDMLTLAIKPNPTAKDIELLERMKDVIKGSDIMKAKDMICKIIGAYEPTKIEVTDVTYKIGFDLDSDDAEIIDEK